MSFPWDGSIIDQYLTEDMANYQISHGSISVAYYINLINRRSIVHAHPFYEYILVRKGKADYQANGQRFSIYPGEMLLISPGILHAMFCDEKPDSYERIILQTNTVFMETVLEETGFKDRIGALPPIYIIQAEAVHSWNIQGLFERMHRALSIEDVKRRERICRCQLMELMLTIELIHDTFTPKVPQAYSALVADVTAFIQEHFLESSLKVADIAKKFYVSREHLSRTFKEYTGDSLRSYLLELRMQEFRNGLIKGKPVVTACQESGFSDYSSFTRSFHKLYGVSPVEYRDHLNRAIDQGALPPSAKWPEDA